VSFVFSFAKAIAFVAAGFTPAIFSFEFGFLAPGTHHESNSTEQDQFKGARLRRAGARKGRRYKT
jgi:hypothetical protein